MTSPFQTPIEENLPWLAGLLEGNGCFGVTVKRSTYSPYIEVQLVDEQLLSTIAWFFETRVRMSTNPDHPDWQPIYRTTLYQKEKVVWLFKRLIPYFSQRKQLKVQELIRFMDPGYVFDPKQALFANSCLPEPYAEVPSSREVKSLSDSELQWLTGLLEAKGHIHFDRRSTIPSPGIVVKSSDQDLIAYVSTLLNQRYTVGLLKPTPEHHRPIKWGTVEYILSVKSRNRVEAYLSQCLVHCHGVSLSKQILEALDSLEAYKTWKSLPCKNRPLLWPKKLPRK